MTSTPKRQRDRLLPIVNGGREPLILRRRFEKGKRSRKALLREGQKGKKRSDSSLHREKGRSNTTFAGAFKKKTGKKVSQHSTIIRKEERAKSVWSRGPRKKQKNRGEPSGHT